MTGGIVLHLLAGLLVIFAPALSLGHDSGIPAPVRRPQAKYLTPRSLPLRPPAREPDRTIRRFPVHSGQGSGFSELVRAAGLIFSGTVIRVQPQAPPNGQSLATVAVTFHVENALRGSTPGRNLTIYEWLGLWSSGQRYRTGERVLLFLYPPSKLGLTSTVAGSIGRFAVDPRGTMLLSPRHISTFQSHPVLGGKSRVSFSDFALAVKQAREEE